MKEKEVEKKKKKPDVFGGKKEPKGTGVEHDARPYLRQAVCTVTCGGADKGPGLVDVVPRQYKQKQPVTCNPEPLRDMFKYA
jgi:hypothetical protein